MNGNAVVTTLIITVNGSCHPTASIASSSGSVRSVTVHLSFGHLEVGDGNAAPPAPTTWSRGMCVFLKGARMKTEQVTVKVTKQLHKGMWSIIINGISGGFTVYPTDADTVKIVCRYDAERFEPHIEVRD